MTELAQTKRRLLDDGQREKLIYGSILGFIGLSATGLGFAGTLTDTKKSDTQYNTKHRYNIALNAEATKLACKALAIGSVFAVCGVSVIVYGIWKIAGASNFQEFRAFYGNRLPRVPVKPLISYEKGFMATMKSEYEDLFSAREKSVAREQQEAAAAAAATDAAAAAAEELDT